MLLIGEAWESILCNILTVSVKKLSVKYCSIKIKGPKLIGLYD